MLNDPAETTGSTDPNITTSETTAPPDTLLVLPLSEPVALESVDYAPTSDKGGLASPSSTVGDINLMQLAAFLLPTLGMWGVCGVYVVCVLRVYYIMLMLCVYCVYVCVYVVGILCGSALC